MYLRIMALFLVAGALALAVAGCSTASGSTKVSGPYIMQTERVDQVVEGNRGYLKGTPPPPEDLTGRKRPLIAVDIDLPPTNKEANVPETHLVKTEAAPAPQPYTAPQPYVAPAARPAEEDIK